MQVTVLGAGPAGLYAAYLIGRQTPSARIRVIEQNPANATFGFGVVFSDRALDFLRTDDEATHAAIRPHLETWSDITLVHRDQRITIDGIGFAAIGRLQLLQILQQRARSVGIAPDYRRTITAVEEIAEADLIIAADGVNSLIRRALGSELGAATAHSSNRFVWYGTRRRFDTLTQTFRTDEHGAFNAHHYRYSPTMSTFIVECDAATYARAGFDGMNEEATRTYVQRVFAEDLCGEPLVSNKSVWRRFPKVSNERWSHRNVVLVGDALRTAHFSIGSGTRLAMEDAIALAGAMRQHPGDITGALAAYETARRPIVEKLVAAANASADWYERFAEHMALSPLDFAMSYIARSGRIDPGRLRRLCPRFAATYEATRGALPS